VLRYIGNMTIKHKLIGIIAVIMIISITIITGFFVWTDLTYNEELLRKNINTVAVVVGDNIISDLNWGDTKDGEKALKTLENINSIKYAEVYKKDNVLFATYNAMEGKKIPDFKPIEGESVFKEGYLFVFKPIIHEKIKYGSILIVTSTQELTNRVYTYVVRVSIFAVLLIFFTIIVANMLQKVVSLPIIQLSEFIAEVSKKHDYSVKIDKKFNDEVGLLYDGFNHMMEQVNSRNNEIETSRKFLINVLDSIPLVIIALNKDDIVTHWNNFAENVTGITRDNAVEHNIYNISPDFDRFADHHLDILEKGEHFVFNRVQFGFSKDSFFKVTLYPLIASDGLIIMIDDITELEKKEMQLRQVQKMETVGNLASGLAHDFNNVLGGITGALSLLNFKIEKGVEIKKNELATQLSIIEKSSERAAGVVQKLLSLSRKNDVLFSEVDINIIVKDTLAIVENSIDKSVEINCHYNENESIVFADGGQLGQALLNLFVNAGHAMTIMRPRNEKWGGVLDISLDLLDAGEYFKKQYPEAKYEQYWQITIGDNGIGMEEETVKKIFNPFFTTKEKEKGTGLGLSMSYSIVEQHDGFIDVYSEVGVGSTFKVFLPVLKSKNCKLEPTDEKKYYSGTGLILIVDDDDHIRSVASGILEECGYDILIARDGIEALEIFSERMNDISVVLLDLVMPKLDGKHTFIRMREMRNDIKVLLSSGFRQDNRVNEIINMGVKGFVQKPYTFSKLSEHIFNVMDDN